MNNLTYGDRIYIFLVASLIITASKEHPDRILGLVILVATIIMAVEPMFDSPEKK